MSLSTQLSEILHALARFVHFSTEAEQLTLHAKIEDLADGVADLEAAVGGPTGTASVSVAATGATGETGATGATGGTGASQ